MANKKDENSATSGEQDTKVPERVVDGLPTMYCFETCPFCFKVKALLGSRGIEYSKVEVDPTFKTQLKWAEWSAVPVFVDIDGTQVNDSNYILHYIDSKDSSSFPRAGEDPEQDEWMDFSNLILGKSIVAVIYKSYRTSVQALDYVTKIDNFSFGTRLVNKWVGGIIMRMVGKSRAKMFELPPRENHSELSSAKNSMSLPVFLTFNCAFFQFISGPLSADIVPPFSRRYPNSVIPVGKTFIRP